MQRDIIWSSWAQVLKRWGLSEMTAALLEGLGPLTIILAQVGYLTRPFLEWTLPLEQWETMIELLENQKSGRDFALILRQEATETGTMS